MAELEAQLGALTTLGIDVILVFVEVTGVGKGKERLGRVMGNRLRSELDGIICTRWQQQSRIERSTETLEVHEKVLAWGHAVATKVRRKSHQRAALDGRPNHANIQSTTYTVEPRSSRVTLTVPISINSVKGAMKIKSTHRIDLLMREKGVALTLSKVPTSSSLNPCRPCSQLVFCYLQS